MPNPFYNVTNNPIARTLGRSDVMRAEFALVEDGFDETKAQLDLKAPLAKGTSVPVTLVFQDAKGAESRLNVSLPVATTPPGGATAGSMMDGHKH